MSTTAPHSTTRLSRVPGGLVWHPLLGPSGDSGALQHPLPLDCRTTAAPEHAITPELRINIISVVTALVEVLAGRRPPHQLHGWVSATVVDQVERLCVDHQQRDWRLRSLRAQQPSLARVEATVHLVQAGRSRVVALCLSGQQQHWTITEFCITPVVPT